MRHLSKKQLLFVMGGLLAAAIFASPLFFIPYPQNQFQPVDPSPVQLAAMQRIDLNTADIEQLKLLPGIGEKRACAIVAYREKHGQFTSMADLTNVPGVTYDLIQQWQGIAWVKIMSAG